MKIQKMCDDKINQVAPPLTHSKIPTGTVYRYGSHECGPYLKVLDGFVDLKLNAFYGAGYVDAPANNYLVLPNARIVLE